MASLSDSSDKTNNEFSSIEEASKSNIKGVISGERKIKVTTVKIHKDPDDNMHVCSLCKIRLKTKKQIVSHIHNHRKERPNEYFDLITESENAFKCKKCESLFSTKQEFDLHITSHCTSKCDQVHTNEKPCKCESCKISCFTRETLNTQYQSLTKSKSPVRELSENEEDALENNDCEYFPSKKQKVGPFYCELCRRNFTKKLSLQVHYRLHTGEKPYQCEICKDSFTQKGSLNYHYRTHKKEKSLLTNRALNGGSSKCKLESKITEDKPFNCETCQKKFMLESSLIAHYLVHTKEKYECEICRARFTSKRMWNNHCVHHPEEKTL